MLREPGHGLHPGRMNHLPDPGAIDQLLLCLRGDFMGRHAMCRCQGAKQLLGLWPTLVKRELVESKVEVSVEDAR